MIVATSPAIGVRESRRVHGDYRLTRDDVLGGRRFDDEIALCGAPIEDHGAGGDTAWQYVGDAGVYGIPYRCLLPAGIDGLLVAGRCFSATHDAHASARSMATCMAMGQAAGTAAAMAAADGVDATRPSAAGVRARLLRRRRAARAAWPPGSRRDDRRRRCGPDRSPPPSASTGCSSCSGGSRRSRRCSTLVDELADAGARVFEVTFDRPSAEADLGAVRAPPRARGDGPFLAGAARCSSAASSRRPGGLGRRLRRRARRSTGPRQRPRSADRPAVHPGCADADRDPRPRGRPARRS